MYPKSLLLALLCIIAAFISCDQSEDEPASTPEIPRIKTITYHTGANTNSETYEYDSSGRVIKISYSNGTYDQYDYRTDTIIRKSFLFSHPDTLLLDSHGRIVSEMFGNTIYEYDPSGKLAKANLYNSEGELDMSFEYRVFNKNTITLDIWESVNGTLKHTITYDYGILYNSINTIGLENKGMSFYGKQDENLVAVKKLITLAYNITEVVNYRYALDARNRVVKKWAEESQDDVYETYTYY